MFELLRVPVRSEFRSVFPRSRNETDHSYDYSTSCIPRVSRKSRAAVRPRWPPVESDPLDRCSCLRLAANKIERTMIGSRYRYRNRAVGCTAQRKIGKCMLAWRTPEAAAGVAGELRGCCTGSAVPTGNNSIALFTAHAHTVGYQPFCKHIAATRAFLSWPAFY